MNRRRVFGLAGVLALALIAGRAGAVGTESPRAKTACDCCGASCACPVCVCDSVKAKAGACDCCGGATCCAVAAKAVKAAEAVLSCDECDSGVCESTVTAGK